MGHAGVFYIRFHSSWDFRRLWFLVIHAPSLNARSLLRCLASWVWVRLSNSCREGSANGGTTQLCGFIMVTRLNASLALSS